jgi:hypothetical protein
MRERGAPGTVHQSTGAGSAEEARLDRLPKLDHAADQSGLGKAQRESVFRLVQLWLDLDQLAQPLAINHLQVLVDQEEAAVGGHAQRRQLDFRWVQQAEALDW